MTDNRSMPPYLAGETETLAGSLDEVAHHPRRGLNRRWILTTGE
jgi:hypothetical protein